MTRAKQTAEIISQKIGKDVIESPFFAEGLYSTRLLGMPVKDPEAIAFVKTYFEHFSESDLRLEDGENFADLKKRVLAGLDLLSKRPEEHIAVVSHAFFLWIIAAAGIFGEGMTAKECKGIIQGFDLMRNTGLTVLTHGAPVRKATGEPVSPWQLVVWNDHAHLG